LFNYIKEIVLFVTLNHVLNPDLSSGFSMTHSGFRMTLSGFSMTFKRTPMI